MSLGYRETPDWYLRYEVGRGRKTLVLNPDWQIREYERVMGLPPPANHEPGTVAYEQWTWRNRRDGEPAEIGVRRKPRDAEGAEGPRPTRRRGRRPIGV